MTHTIEISEHYDTSFFKSGWQMVYTGRVIKLIEEAISRDPTPSAHGCVIGYPRLVDGKINYLFKPKFESVCFLAQDENLWIVGGIERGKESPTAIFPSGIHMAADYFIFVLTEGRVKLDWTLYLPAQ